MAKGNEKKTITITRATVIKGIGRVERGETHFVNAEDAKTLLVLKKAVKGKVDLETAAPSGVSQELYDDTGVKKMKADLKAADIDFDNKAKKPGLFQIWFKHCGPNSDDE